MKTNLAENAQNNCFESCNSINTNLSLHFQRPKGKLVDIVNKFTLNHVTIGSYYRFYFILQDKFL